MTQLEVSPKSHMRPLKCAYDPLLPPPLGSSVQLTAQISSILQQDHPNSILLTPSEPSVAVPWPSSLLHCRQNIYWREAESAARALIPQLHTLSRQNGAKIPKELQQADGKTTESDVEKMKAIRKKETEFVDTVVGCGVYMHPNANKERMQLIVQALLVLWTHDDTVEENPEDLGQTATDQIMQGFESTTVSVSKLSTSAPLFVSLFTGLFVESPSLGVQLARTMLDFIRNTCTQEAARTTRFPSLRAYLDFRSVDFGRDFNFAAVRFARDIELSPDELAPFKRLEDLADDHHMLVNDLYSFAKEVEEHERDGGDKPLFNAVGVMKELLGLRSWDEAKVVVGDLIMRWEELAKGEVGVLNAKREEGLLNERQWSYVEGVLQSMAGNQFFSATAPRYYRAAVRTASAVEKRHRDTDCDEVEIPSAKRSPKMPQEDQAMELEPEKKSNGFDSMTWV